MPVRRGLREDGAKDGSDADEDEGVHSLVGPVVGAIKARMVSERLRRFSRTRGTRQPRDAKAVP